MAPIVASISKQPRKHHQQKDTSSSSIDYIPKSPTSSTSPSPNGYLNPSTSPPPRVSPPPPTQDNASMDITLTLSPNTPLDVQFDTPSPSPPIIAHPIPWNFLEAHEYTQLEIQEFRETLIQHMESVKKSIDKRALHKREYDSMVNERQMQTTKEKVDMSKALDASLVNTESSGTESEKQNTSSKLGNDIDADDADIKHVYDEEPMAEVLRDGLHWEGVSHAHDEWENNGINTTRLNEIETESGTQEENPNVMQASKHGKPIGWEDDKVEESYFVLPMAVVAAIKHKFDNTLVMRDDEGVHFFKFDSSNGVEHVLQQVSVDKDLKENVIMAVPFKDGMGHSKETIRVEYEWKPPTCSDCRVFRHSIEKCPKRPIEPIKHKEDGPLKSVQDNGFTTVTNKKKKGTKLDNRKRHIEGLRFQKPRTSFVYQPVNPQPKHNKDVKKSCNDIKLKNMFEALGENDGLQSEYEVGDPSNKNNGMQEEDQKSHKVDSDSEVEEVFVEPRPKKAKPKGASTPSNDVSNVYVCAILETHVDLSTLAKVCSKVFHFWDWTSNANFCFDGCRIIVDWNIDIVDLMVLSQSNQALHVKIVHKAMAKTFLCSFIYADNNQYVRRQLWNDPGLHKKVVRDAPWILMGDFNIALNMEETYSGSSAISSDMSEFKESVSKIEVLDINASGLHFTWNQKPRGGNGILKKLDRIMGNLAFVDDFPGAYVIFQPYRIFDHAPAVLTIPTLVSSNPKPFKFYNFLTHKSKFLDLVSSHWNMQVNGHNMFKVMSKIRALKKPLRKLLHNHRNLHEHVTKLRHELDVVQKDLDLNPADPILREEEAAYNIDFT
ncbi:hypothetical protein Tco_1226198 [Tanacetum coccineum]